MERQRIAAEVMNHSIKDKYFILFHLRMPLHLVHNNQSTQAHVVYFV